MSCTLVIVALSPQRGRRSSTPAPGSGFAVGSKGGLSRHRNAQRSAISWGVSCFSNLLGHEGDRAGLDLIDLAARNRFERAALELENDAILAVLDQQAGEHAALGGGNRRGLVARADHQAGVEDVGEQLLEVVASIRGDLRADFLPFAVNLVALGADPLKTACPATGSPGVVRSNLRICSATRSRFRSRRSRIVPQMAFTLAAISGSRSVGARGSASTFKTDVGICLADIAARNALVHSGRWVK